MKKSFWALLASLTLAATMTATAACAEPATPTPGGEPGTEEPGENPSQDSFAITMGGGGLSRTLDVGESSSVTWTVTKNGEAVTDEPVTVDVSDDAVLSWDEESGEVTALAEGRATLTVSLVNHTDVSATVTFVVTDYFFSRKIQRGNINFNNESNGSVSITGGQATLVTKDSGTQFVFRATITLPASASVATNQSFGIGSFVNSGDNALWFGLRNDDGQNDGIYSVYQRNFYNGWGAATTDAIVTGYNACNVGNEIDFEIIRDGTDYYYSIGGYYGTYTDNTSYEEETYPGIYSQEIAFTVTDFSVSYDAETVAAAAAAYAEKGVAAVVINETTSRLLRGNTYNFTATVYPTAAAEDAQIEWTLDKTGMTAGTDGTSVSSSGALTIAADAEGSLTLIAACDGAEARFDIDILTEPDEAENDQLTVSGGVQLNENGSITFPEALVNVDGVVNEQDYADAVYSAVLKENVTTNFSVSFTVSDYRTTAQFPKLQIALGEGANNFYVVYKPDGTYRIEAYAGGVFTDGRYVKGWFNSDPFEGAFDPAEEHTFTISVAQDGTYTVSVDGTPLAFNMDGNKATLKRDYNAFSTEQPVKFATKGVSATVSDIQVTDGGTIDYPAFWSYNANTWDITDTGFTMRLTSLSWNTRDNYGNRIIGTTALPADFTLEFTLTFSEANDDSKFVIRIGNWEYHVLNKMTAGSMEGSIYKGAFGNNIPVPDAGLTLNIRLERQGDAVRFIINDTVIEDVPSGADTATVLEFYAFNSNATYANETVTVSDLSVGAYSRVDIEQDAWAYSDNGNVTNVTENGFTLRADQGGWGNEEQSLNKITSSQAFEGDSSLTFGLAFSGNMQDGKFVVMIGGTRVMINNKLGAGGAISVTVNKNGEDWSEETAGIDGLSMQVKIVRVGTVLQVYINDVLKKTANCDTSTSVSFFVFNEKAEEADVTATLSGFSIGDYTSSEAWAYSNSTNVTNVTENGFTLRADDDGWNNGDQGINKILSTQEVSGDVTIEFTLAFSAGMTDGKFIIELGGQRIMINNINGGTITVNIIGYDRDKEEIAGTQYAEFKVRIVRSGETISLYINDSAEPVRTGSGAIGNSSLAFFLFNSTAEDIDVTATVSGFTITSGTASAGTNE